ncbi:DMT family transporter [Benzoatithermus flavus]|uniref:DMT family transporter n=1 Tax=Benzoatithermus flavus TaxID=3108223 RepID=A0ABU8XRJ1_9PROT
MSTIERAARAAGPTRSVPWRTDARLSGILFLCAGAFVFSLQDIVIKWISGTYPITQVLTIRCIVAIGPLLLILAWDGGFGGLRTRRLGLQILRGGCLFLSYTAYYLAIAALPLAEAVALFYSAPLFILALSVPLLGERVGPRQWLAVLVGFLGMLVVCRPGIGMFEPAALFSMASAFVYAVGQVLARDLGRTERASVMTFYHNLVNLTAASAIGLLAGSGTYARFAHPSLQFLLRGWVAPGLRDLLIMAATGLIAAFGSWCLTNAYRVTAANVVAPFEYSAILWATSWGFLVWGERPAAVVLLGIAMIVAAGLYVLRAAPARA